MIVLTKVSLTRLLDGHRGLRGALGCAIGLGWRDESAVVALGSRAWACREEIVSRAFASWDSVYGKMCIQA